MKKTVLSVQGGDKEASQVHHLKDANGQHQKWKVLYLDEKKPTPGKGFNKEFGFHIGRPFLMVSQVYQERFLYYHPNSYVYGYNRSNKPDSRLSWYFDQGSKTIKSKAVGTVSVSLSGGNMRMLTTTSSWFQLWKMNGPYLTNIKGQVASLGTDVTHDTHMGHVKTVTLNKSRPEQKFEIVYLDQWKGDPKKGELNRDFGFRVDVDFHIVSELASRRYL